MKLIDRILGRKKTSASVAKERLQIIISHERSKPDTDPDYLLLIQQEILEVVAKYVKVDKDQVKVQLERDGDSSVIELNVTLPDRIEEALETA